MSKVHEKESIEIRDDGKELRNNARIAGKMTSLDKRAIEGMKKGENREAMTKRTMATSLRENWKRIAE